MTVADWSIILTPNFYREGNIPFIYVAEYTDEKILALGTTAQEAVTNLQIVEAQAP